MSQLSDAATNGLPDIRGERMLILPPMAAFVALALFYSYIIPLGYGPDEPRHFNAIKLLWADHLLPRVLPDGRELGNAIALHPISYYLLEGVLWYPGQWLAHALAPHLRHGLLRRLVIGAEPARVPDRLLPRAVLYRLFRLTSPLWGLMTIWLVFKAVRCAWPRAPWLAAGVAWGMALWPHLLMNFATITNDCAANLAGAIFIWYWACRAPQVSARAPRAIHAGLVLAIAALMKVHVAVALTAVTAVLLAWYEGAGFWRRPAFWAQLLGAIGIMAFLAAPWYVRNLLLYGRINYVPQGYSIIPPGMSALDALLAGILPSAFLSIVSGLFRSIWAQVGWFPKTLAPSLYALLLIFTLAAAAGIALLARRRPLSSLSREALARALPVILPFPAAWLLALYAALFVHFGWHEGGRYLLFALPGFLVFMVAGWQQLTNPKGAIYIFVALLMLLNAACAYNLVTYLNPTFGTSVLIGQ